MVRFPILEVKTVASFPLFLVLQVALVLAESQNRVVADFGLNLLLSAVRTGRLPADAAADLYQRLSVAVETGALQPQAASRIFVVLSALAGEVLLTNVFAETFHFLLRRGFRKH